ncbi:NAD(P)H-binding [Gracilaria domingensis]|nr:NAD(P)H-binding [Gracilaria domingensis]
MVTRCADNLFVPAPLLRKPKLCRSPKASFPTCNTRLEGRTVLVTGATGPTGRLICAALRKRGAVVRALVRPKTYMRARHRVESLLEICPSVQLKMGDLRDITTIRQAVSGCDGVISASGTRNFEAGSDNDPEVVDYKGLRTLANCFFESLLEQDLMMMFTDDTNGLGLRGEHGTSPLRQASVATSEDNHYADLSRFVLISSIGVTRPERFPQLQQMGSILTYKLCGEDALRESGCAFTIVRPGGFTDMPAGHLPVILDQGDRLAGSIPRADVAEICAEAIFRESATNVTFECVSRHPSMIDSSHKEGFSPALFNQLEPDKLL